MNLKSGDYVSPPAGYKVNHELTPYAGLISDLNRQRNRPVALATPACGPGVIECYAP